MLGVPNKINKKIIFWVQVRLIRLRNIINFMVPGTTRRGLPLQFFLSHKYWGQYRTLKMKKLALKLLDT